MEEACTNVPLRLATNPQVYLEVCIGDERAGKIVVELYMDVAAKTAENFRALCTGEKGIGKAGKALHYKGSCFHRIIPSFMCQGGDFTAGNGTGGESIYGGDGKFRDENFKLRHSCAGLLSMANAGPNTNGSQFFIINRRTGTPNLDGRHVIFGAVIDGIDVVKRLASQGSSSGRPQTKCLVNNCGEVSRWDQIGSRDGIQETHATAGTRQQQQGAGTTEVTSSPSKKRLRPSESCEVSEKLEEQKKAKVKRSDKVYLDITIGTTFAGRIVIKLKSKIAPKTCENFRQLCTGEAGAGAKGKALHYKGTRFHRIIPGFMLQGGDTTAGDGSGGESIFGGTFEDETFELKHKKRGTVSMANKGPGTGNSSQFFISADAAPWLDGKHVVFGSVREGMDVVREMELAGTRGGRPTEQVRIRDCGQL
jgi:peptidylprolyl isomerase